MNINAYHQPGVEAGKKAASDVLELQRKVVEYMRAHPEPASPEQLADRMGEPQQAERIYHVLEHLSVNRREVLSSRGKFRWKEGGRR